MNINNLKTAGSVVISSLILIFIVIYIPKPVPLRSEKQLRPKIIDVKYLRLALQAISKTNEANDIALHKLEQFASGEKVDFSPSIAANVAAIDALAEVDKSIKLSNEELESHNKSETSPNLLIEANVKLIASLVEISETVKALNIEVQSLEKENAQPLPPSIKKTTDASRKVVSATKKGTEALDKTIDAFSEYYQLDQ